MEQGLISKDTLTAIASAIRKKNGGTSRYTPGEMPAAIGALSEGSGSTERYWYFNQANCGPITISIDGKDYRLESQGTSNRLFDFAYNADSLFMFLKYTGNTDADSLAENGALYNFVKNHKMCIEEISGDEVQYSASVKGSKATIYNYPAVGLIVFALSDFDDATAIKDIKNDYAKGVFRVSWK